MKHVLLLAGLVTTITFGAPEEAVIARVQAVEELSSASGDEALHSFIAEHVAPGYVSSFPEGELIALLKDIRRISSRAGDIRIEPDADGIRLSFRGSENADVLVQVDDEPPHLISTLRLDRDVTEQKAAPDAPEITWDNLADRLDEAERNGFSGAVLVVRDGKELLHRGYGKSDREHGRPNAKKTIFGIGSTPIDFTRASILLLEQTGKLKLSDTIDAHLDGVPEDKRTITLDHLMTGRSGLPNFHHLPDVDTDFDLSWIDRQTAIRRIMDRELLFEPGTDKAHSHSAFGLLAAIVEIVSGSTYGEFLERNIFEPANMKRTGFYGSNINLPDKEFAVGYGYDSVGKINIPPYWGKTSWLVMGSGGMFSTTEDMHRFVRLIESGKLLKGKARERLMRPGVSAGASDRGFLFMYALGKDNLMFLASNTLEDEGHTESTARALASLIMND